MLSPTVALSLLAMCAMVASEAGEDPIHVSPHVDLKRISKKDREEDMAVSSSITREQHVLSGNLLDLIEDYDPRTKSLQNSPQLPSGPRFSSNGIKFGEDLLSQKDSRAKTTSAPGKSSRGYGYPFLIAPTLPPFPRANSDAHEKEPKSKNHNVRIAIPQIPTMPEMPKFPEEMRKLSKPGGSFLKKRKDSGFDEPQESKLVVPISRRYGVYKEPSYRNFFDLEVAPDSRSYDGRRIEYGPYSPPSSYHGPSGPTRPATSPRDPYLSPSDEPVDGFYPKVYKSTGETPSHSSYGKRGGYYGDPYDSHHPSSGREYGEDSSEEFGPHPSSPHDDFRLGDGGFMKSHKYSGDSGSYSESSPHGSPSSGGYNSGYSSLQNSPIVGETRKRLLDYTGATDIYEGEPDYLKDAARKPKFSSIQSDYYPYARSHSFDFLNYDFDENRPQQSRIKRSPRGESDVPGCAANSTIPVCLTDDRYPEIEVKNAVAKNVQYILQLSGATVEVTEGKKKAPDSFHELTRSRDLCSSSRGDVYPLRARDVKGVWRIIVNVDGVQQSVFMDVCGAPGSTCDFLPRAISSRCHQKHSNVSLLTFDRQDHRLELQDFPIPSACACDVGRPVRVRPE